MRKGRNRMSAELNKINEVLKDHERRISRLEGTKQNKRVKDEAAWYLPGSTIEKIVVLINEGVFDNPKSIKQITSEFENKDYHLKASDLTLPLRKIVRKELLRRTKVKEDGLASKIWLFVKPK